MDTTAAGNKVWVVDGNKKVYVYDVDGVLLGSWTANGLTTPEDITTNGTDIWIVDDGANKVFKYAGSSGNGANRTSGSQNAASSFNLNSNNGNAKGIVTDGTHLWVVNDAASGADKVFKYTLSGSLVGSWTIDANNGSPTGITIDPANVNHIWIVDSADDAVYRYNGATSRTSGSQASDHVFQLAGGNGDAQGIADPPPGMSGNTESLSGRASKDAGVLSRSRRGASGLNHRDRAFADLSAVSSARRRDRHELRKNLRTLAADNVPDLTASIASIRLAAPDARGRYVGDSPWDADCATHFNATDEVFSDLETALL